jgi:multidrug efflux system membrane fusion protein
VQFLHRGHLHLGRRAFEDLEIIGGAIALAVLARRGVAGLEPDARAKEPAPGAGGGFGGPGGGGGGRRGGPASTVAVATATPLICR